MPGDASAVERKPERVDADDSRKKFAEQHQIIKAYRKNQKKWRASKAILASSTLGLAACFIYAYGLPSVLAPFLHPSFRCFVSAALLLLTLKIFDKFEVRKKIDDMVARMINVNDNCDVWKSGKLTLEQFETVGREFTRSQVKELYESAAWAEYVKNGRQDKEASRFTDSDWESCQTLEQKLEEIDSVLSSQKSIFSEQVA